MRYTTSLLPSSLYIHTTSLHQSASPHRKLITSHYSTPNYPSARPVIHPPIYRTILLPQCKVPFSVVIRIDPIQTSTTIGRRREKNEREKNQSSKSRKDPSLLLLLLHSLQICPSFYDAPARAQTKERENQ